MCYVFKREKEKKILRKKRSQEFRLRAYILRDAHCIYTYILGNNTHREKNPNAFEFPV